LESQKRELIPLGVTMSAERRMELLNSAVTAGAWIVEDEHDAEYRCHGRPVAALQSLDRSGSAGSQRLGFERLATCSDAVCGRLKKSKAKL